MRKPWKQRYEEHLRSSYWIALKAKVVKRRGNKCQQCNTDSTPLDLHHEHYKTFGRERQKDVLLLCRSCHIMKDLERKRRGEARRAWYRVCGEFGGIPSDADFRLLEEVGWIKPS